MAAAAIASVTVTGCRPAEDGSPPRPEATTVRGAPARGGNEADRQRSSPRKYLRAVFTRYRTASSYRDQAQVVLEYQQDGQRQRQVAPLKVWYDRGRLHVEAYDVQMRSRANGMICRVFDSTSDDLDSQVLFAPPPQRAASNGVTADRPALDVLLSDPVLAERVAGGLAGPPPQLEWLFADEPMPGLFAAGVQLGYSDDGEIQGHRCHRITAETEGERYVFWIDAVRGLFRRIELPELVVPAAMRDSMENHLGEQMGQAEEAGQADKTGRDVRAMQLRVDLREATFGPPDGDPPTIALPPDPKYVRQFVPLPPPEPPESLGKKLPPFSLQDQTGELTLTQQGSDRELTLIVAVGEDAVSRTSRAIIEDWAGRLPEDFADRIRTVLLVDRDADRPLSFESGLPVVPDPQGWLSARLMVPPGGLAITAQDGTIAWLQPQLTAAHLPSLGAVVADILGGVDVPARLREQWRSDVDSYRAELERQQVRPASQ